jgi:hypothetical protein
MIGWRMQWSVSAFWVSNALDSYIHGLAEQLLKLEYIPTRFDDVLTDHLGCRERKDTELSQSDIPSRINKASSQGSARF